MRCSAILTSLVLGWASLLTLGCGGQSQDDGDEGGSSGGASSSSGATGGSDSSGGESSTAGGGQQAVCCTADPTCGPGEAELASAADCPPGSRCYQKTMCCSSIWCALADVQCDATPDCDGDSVGVAVCPQDAVCTSHTLCGTTILCQEVEPTQCNALPVCPDGNEEVQECPPNGSCSTHTLCGTSILCSVPENPPSCGGGPRCPADTREVSGCPGSGECESLTVCGTTIYCLSDGGGACDPDDPNRQYLAESPALCAEVDISCAAGLSGFDDECGCGCEQHETCPEYLNCMPGGDVDSRCADPEACPLSERAY